MSASRVKFLASKAKVRDDSEDEDYDSEEERYRWKQQRLLKKVEESASFIRTVNEITRPFVTGTWRLEREEQRKAAGQASTLDPSPEKKLQPAVPTKPSESWSDSNDSCDKPSGSRRKSIWSPVKHAKTSDVRSVLEMEKTPSWKPLRKSKARQSLALLNAENACKSPAALEDDLKNCKPLEEHVIPIIPPTTKVLEERTPLRAVATCNRALERKQSITVTSGSPSVQCLSESDSLVSDMTPKAKNDSRKTCSSTSRNNDNEDKLMDTPLKASSKDETDAQTPKNPTQSFLKSFKSPVRCSPILLQAYGEEYAKVRGSIGSPDKVVNLDNCTSPKDPSKVLTGVTAYVEVRRGEDDRTGGFRWKLKQLGATVSDTLNRKVTHVVFQEGLLSTFRKARQLGVHLVSTHWVMACDESFTKVLETRYPIEKLSQYDRADPLLKSIKRPKIMSPDLGSGRDDKVLSRRLQRRSIKVSSPLTLAPCRAMGTLSPVKNDMKRMTLSPRSKQTSVKDPDDDDWDGFLAMVEAEVRDKAESRRKAGEMSGTIEDFETRLQRLLGRGEEQPPNQPSLALIFQKDKSSSFETKTKTGLIKNKKIKPSLESAASSSIMANWLQRCSSDSGQTSKNQDLSSASAAIVASAAADEILNSIFKSTISKPNAKVDSNSAQRIAENSSKTVSQEPSAFTSKSKHSKLTSRAKKTTHRNKLDFQGSAACSGAMHDWLSGLKSPIQQHKSTSENVVQCIQSSPLKEKSNRKRKAGSLVEIELDPTEGNVNNFNPCKKHHGEVTPEKQVPPKDYGSAVKSCKKTSDLTPRRRSLRLTPIKSTMLLSSVRQLETLEESKVTTFEKSETFTPRKDLSKLSSVETPRKCSSKKICYSK